MKLSSTLTAACAGIALCAASAAFAQTGSTSDQTGSTAGSSRTSDAQGSASQSSSSTRSGTQGSATEGRIRSANAEMENQLPATNASEAFIEKAATDSMAEVQTGKLAQSKAESQSVKDFAERMIMDHGMANDELASIAKKHDIDMPKSVGAEHKAAMDKLSALSGAAFDRAYKEQMIQDHEKAVALFTEAQGKVNSDLSGFASKTLPKLQDHLRMARAMQTGSRQASATGASSSSSTSDRSSSRDHRDHDTSGASGGDTGKDTATRE